MTYRSVQKARTTFEDIKQALDSGIFFLYVTTDNETKDPIAFAGFHFSYSTFNGRQCHLSDLYVSTSARGQKMGELLVKKAFEDIWKRHGCKYFVAMAASDVSRYFEYTLKAENIRKVEEFVHFMIPEEKLEVLSQRS